MGATARNYKIVEKQNSFLWADEINKRSFILPAHRNKIIDFLESEKVLSLSEIDYDVRLAYEKYVLKAGVKNRPQDYVNALDRIVMDYRKSQAIHLSGAAALEYKSNRKIYLLYEVRPDKADYLNKMRDKSHLVWDFSLDCPKEFKKQITTVLSNIIENMDENEDLRLKRRHLITLKYLYEFCYKHQIHDLMALNKVDENRFYMHVSAVDNYFKVFSKVLINQCRKVLFLNGADINWKANVWYMERFLLDESRLNESSRVETITFLNIKNTENRNILQEYIRYLIGLTDMSISTIRTIKYRLEEFVIHIGEKHIYDVTPYDIDGYIEGQYRLGNSKSFIDRKLVLIDKWYKNLFAYEYIEKLPFEIDYYTSSKFECTHNDRAVEENIISLILMNLGNCDEQLRLMFLIQLCTARRISEVCQIKANKVIKSSGDYWIGFYQPKMHEDIMVPVPKELFRLVRKYIKEKKIGLEEYVFHTKKGKAYNSGLYQKKMIKFCEEAGICAEGYNFQSHDFRHTIATGMYNHGTSIQAIRDFLGHKTDEMTKQYIDFIPKEVEKRSRALFEEKLKGREGEANGQAVSG